MSKRTDPLELLSRQVLIGLGRVFSRAVGAAGKQVTKDIENAAEEIKRRAGKAAKRLDEIFGEDFDK